MNIRHLPLLFLLPLLALACEGPKRTNQKPKPAQTKTQEPTPAPEPKPEPEPEPAPAKPEKPAEPVEVFSATRSIDGRKRPSAQPTNPTAVHALRTYSFGAAPQALEVPNSSVRIEPLTEVAELPVVHKSASLRSVAMEGRALEWEAALLQRGIDVLDRSSMPQIEREFFLQEARLPATGAAPRDIIKTPLVGREVVTLGREHSPAWMLQNDVFHPLLNGRSVADSIRLPVGHHIAAQALLETSDFDIAVEQTQLEAARPTAKSIDYVPQVLTAVKRPDLVEHSWSMDASDPFHAVSKNGPVFFDPKTRALWTLTDAWVGTEVTRDAYIARRTSTLKSFCPACARELTDKAVTTKPSDKEIPMRWKCTECADVQPTRYVDGYTDGSQIDAAVSLTLRQTWVEPKAGSYPVLAAEDAIRTVLRSASAWQQFEVTSLTKETATTKLGLEADHDWCHVDEAMLATLVPHAESRKLTDYFAAGMDPAGKFLVPGIDANGAQIYVLATETTTRETVQVPVATLSVSVRAIGVEDTRLLCAGTLRLSYRNLLDSAKELPVTTDGLDLKNWPTVAQQREALTKAACARIAAMLKP
jgi:hypothetical protein